MDEKNDRNRVLSSKYTDSPDSVFTKKVTITGDEKLLQSPNGKLMIETAVNLVSRFNDKLHIHVPSSPQELRNKLNEIAKGVGTNVLMENDGIPDVIISIGNVECKGEFIIRINSNGWVSLVSCNEHVEIFDDAPQNPIGAMGAACFGAAEAFKRLLEISGGKYGWIKEHPAKFIYSFLDHSNSARNCNFPTRIKISDDLLLVGAGAVGSAFVYSLSKLDNLYGIMTVVDPDSFDKTNLNRCLIAYTGDVGNNKAKTAEKYARDGLKIAGLGIKYEEYRSSTTKRFPLVISTVDEDKPRYEIQGDLPKRIFHGGTFESKATIAIIDFLKTGCLCCMFESSSSYEEIIANETGISEEDVKKIISNHETFSIQHVDILKKKIGDKAESYRRFIGQPFSEVYTKEICGTMPIQTGQETKNASVSFVSFFSGLVLASEIIKAYSEIHQYPLISDSDFIRINLLIPTPYHLAKRAKNMTCTLKCNEENTRDIFRKKWN